MTVLNCATLGSKIDQAFIDYANRFVNWLPYEDGAHPYADVAQEIDLYIVDVSGTRNPPGFQYCQWLNRERPQAHLLVLLDLTSAIRYNGRLKDMQFTGLLLRTAASETIEQAIKTVAVGRYFCDPDLKDVYPKVNARKITSKPFVSRRWVTLEPSEVSQDDTSRASAKIRRAWFPPKLPENRPVLHSVKLSFMLAENGFVYDLAVLASSEEELFDKAGIDAVQRAQLVELPINTRFTVCFNIEIEPVKSVAVTD